MGSWSPPACRHDSSGGLQLAGRPLPHRAALQGTRRARNPACPRPFARDYSVGLTVDVGQDRQPARGRIQLQHLQHLASLFIIGGETQHHEIGPALADRDVRRRILLEEVDTETIRPEDGLDAEQRLRTRTNNQGSRHDAAGDLFVDGRHINRLLPGDPSRNAPYENGDFPTEIAMYRTQKVTWAVREADKKCRCWRVQSCTRAIPYDPWMTFANFVGGQWVPASSGATLENRNPANARDLVGTFADSTAAVAEVSISAARRAFVSWLLVPASKRADT